jgi:predicted nucleotidyltransferase
MSGLAELLAPPSEAAAGQALASYASAVSRAYGDRLVGVFLFGSRARGGHRPDSDADLAIVLSAFEGDAVAEKMKLIDLGFDALTDVGVMIQPWPFTHAQWSGREPAGRFKDLLLAARRDAVPVVGTP